MVEADLFGGDGGKLRVVLNRQFSRLQPADREDILAESYLIALRRGMLNKPLSWAAATSLLIDAYRKLFKTRKNSSYEHWSTYPVDPEHLIALADMPNQIADLETKERLPEIIAELEFEEFLKTDEGQKSGLKRYMDTLDLTDSTPFLPRDFARYAARHR